MKIPAFFKPIWLVTIMFCFAVLPAFSVDLTIEYLEGYLDEKDGDEWLELFIGDEIPDSATIKLYEDSIAELTAPGIKLTLTKEGIYEVENLVKASSSRGSSGLASLIGNKVASILEEPKQSQTVTMGVRGDEQSGDEIQWMSDESSELLKTGKTRLKDGEIEDALDLFEEAYDFGDETTESEILFYLAYTYSIIGDIVGAYESLEDIEVDFEAEYYPNLVIFKGQLLIETFAYTEAAEWLSENIDNLADYPESKQTALLLEGISHIELGDKEKARSALSSSAAIDAESDAGMVAADLINQL